MELKERIEQLLSEILSDKYECKVTLRFVPKENNQERGERDGQQHDRMQFNHT